jgi:hypothetical protein
MQLLINFSKTLNLHVTSIAEIPVKVLHRQLGFTWEGILGKWQSFVVGAFPDLIDVHLGLYLSSMFQKEMQIVSEHEYRDTEMG